MQYFICSVFVCATLTAVTKDELRERGYEHAKEGLKESCVGTVKLALAARTLLTGDWFGSLYIQSEAAQSFSQALDAFKDSYKDFKDARQWREEREHERQN